MPKHDHCGLVVLVPVLFPVRMIDGNVVMADTNTPLGTTDMPPALFCRDCDEAVEPSDVGLDPDWSWIGSPS